MNIAISGYGRMGKEVERIAVKRGHNILLRIDTKKDWEKLNRVEKEIKVIIDFSLPETAVKNILRCFKLEIPIITGTTGWYKKLTEIRKACNQLNATLFYAPNFSIGVNVFFKINQHLAKLMNGIDGYDISIEETHHIHKLDAPSGTAIKAAEDILTEYQKLNKWVNVAEHKNDELPIISKREGEVSGTHQVVYNSEVDKLIIKHEAKSRAGFALGAVLAAEFVADKKGIFTMDDLFRF